MLVICLGLLRMHGRATFTRICRDDVMSQPPNRKHLRGCATKPDQLNQALQQLGKVQQSHQADAVARVRAIAGSAPRGPGAGGSGSALGSTAGALAAEPQDGSITHARKLVAAATDPKRLCLQDASFHPWF